MRLGIPLQPTSWRALDALWAMLLAVGIANAIAALLLIAGLSLSSPWFLATVAAPWLALGGWPLWVTRRRGNGAAIDLGLRLQVPDLLRGLAGGAAVFAAGLVAGLVTVQISGDFSSAAADEAQNLADTGGLPFLVLLALMVAVGAPFAEELTFRGLLWSGLAKRGARPWIAVAVSAVAFAVMHFEPQRLLVLVTIGAGLGIVRWRTGSLGACIVAHAVNNLPGAIGILLLASGTG